MSGADFGKASRNGHEDDDAVEVDGATAEMLMDAEDGDVETVEVDDEEYVSREEFDELKAELELIKQAVFGSVDPDVATEKVLKTSSVVDKVADNSYRVDQIEEDVENASTENGETEPSKKISKAKKWIDENFQEWSVSKQKGVCVTTNVTEKKRRGREGKSIVRWVRNYGDDRGVTIPYKTVYDAMKQLGQRQEYSFEKRKENDDDPTEYYLWRVEE